MEPNAEHTVVDVTTLIEELASSQTSFTTVLILTENLVTPFQNAQGQTEMVRYYSRFVEAQGDPSLPTFIKDAIASIYRQDNRPEKVGVGYLAPLGSEVTTITINNPGNDDEVTAIDFLGLQPGHQKANGEGADDLVSELISNANSAVASSPYAGQIVAAPVEGSSNSFTLTARPGLRLEASLVLGAGASGTVTVAAPTVLISEAVEEIRKADDSWFGLVVDVENRHLQEELALWAEGKSFVTFLQSSDPNVQVTGHIDNIAARTRDLGLQDGCVLFHENRAVPYAATVGAERLSFSPDNFSAPMGGVPIKGLEPSRMTTTQKGAVEEKNASTLLRAMNSIISARGRNFQGIPFNVIVTKKWATLRIQELVTGIILDKNRRGEGLPWDDAGLQILTSAARTFLVSAEGTHFLQGSVQVVPATIDAQNEQDAREGHIRIGWSAKIQRKIETVGVRGYIRLEGAAIIDLSAISI